MKTEEQARAMICHVSMNMSPHRQFCIATSCMAWRWGIETDNETAYKTTPIPNQPGMYDHVPMGYCGLAGKPNAQTS